MVWQLLAKPLLGVVADGVRGFVETKKAKAELKVTEVKAATKLKTRSDRRKSKMGSIGGRSNEGKLER
jgi:hypothetical protein